VPIQIGIHLHSWKREDTGMRTLTWVGVIVITASIGGVAARFGYPEIGYVLLALLIVTLFLKKR